MFDVRVPYEDIHPKDIFARMILEQKEYRLQAFKGRAILWRETDIAIIPM